MWRICVRHSYNHALCDIHLVLSNSSKCMVSELSTHSLISLFPVWQRHIFYARIPPGITCLHHEFYQHISHHFHDPACTKPNNPQMFFFSPKHVISLRSHLPHHLRNCSTFDIITACVWKCRTGALLANKIVIVEVVVGGWMLEIVNLFWLIVGAWMEEIVNLFWDSIRNNFFY